MTFLVGTAEAEAITMGVAEAGGKASRRGQTLAAVETERQDILVAGAGWRGRRDRGHQAMTWKGGKLRW